jgi:hypothetical protein
LLNNAPYGNQTTQLLILRQQVRVLPGAPFPFSFGHRFWRDSHGCSGKRIFRTGDGDCFPADLNSVNEKVHVVAPST